MTTETFEPPFARPPEPGEVIEAAPGVLWARFALPFALNHVNIYLVEDGDGWAAIDTGIANDETKAAWDALLTGPLKGSRLTRLIITHHHPDHVGLAGWLAERFDLPVHMSETEYLTTRFFMTGREAAHGEVYHRFYRQHGMSAEEADAAHAYLSALGFPEAGPAEVGDWMEAEEAANNRDWNGAGWEAEEQLRAALSVQAVELVGDEQAVLVALTHVTSQASDAVHAAAEQAASRFGIDDDGLIRAAAGAATQGAYLAALVLAAGEDEDHAFAHKFRLFEAGRWPLGVSGATLNIF